MYDWKIGKPDREKILELSEGAGVNSVAALLLLNRGIDLPENADEFINGGDELPEMELTDMEKAAQRISDAVENGEKITVYGDYDADGVTATAVMRLYLETMGADVDSYIPDRLTEGYGLNCAAIDRIAARGTKLIVTVDNGISSFGEAEYIKEIGLELVVTDHHKVEGDLPDAAAVVNPQRRDERFTPGRVLAGVGVAFAMVQYLHGGPDEDLLREYGALVALGTVADVVPLTGVNRTLVRYGLSFINEDENTGIAALRASCAGGRKLSAVDMAFSVVPRINAVGRMDAAEKALSLLLCEDPEEAARMAAQMEECNRARLAEEAEIADYCDAYFRRYPERMHDRILVIEGENFHPGVIGIAAARVSDRFGRPAIVISVEPDGSARGSGRSPREFSLYDAILSAQELLEKFGGHSRAAGMTLKAEKIGEFRKKVNEYARQKGVGYPTLNLECKLNGAGIDLSTVEAVELLEPYGEGNPMPLFGIFGLEISKIVSIGGGKHLKIEFLCPASADGAQKKSITAVKFGCPPEDFGYIAGDLVDIAASIFPNEYLGVRSVSIRIRDIRIAKTDAPAVLDSLELYECAKRGEELSEPQKARVFPGREVAAPVYKYIRAKGEWRFSPELLAHRLSLPCSYAGKVRVALDVLTQLGTLVQTPDNRYLPGAADKVNLEDSALYRQLTAREGDGYGVVRGIQKSQENPA